MRGDQGDEDLSSDLKWVALVLLIGLLVRLPFWISAQYPFSYDIMIFFLTGENLVDGLNFYSFQVEHFSDFFNYAGIWYRLVFGGYVYAPPWGLVCSLLVLLCGGSFRLFGPTIYSFLSICDLGLALTTFLLARKYLGRGKALMAGLLSVLSPLFYASAEGQFDVIPTLISSLALLFLGRSPFLSGALLGICIAYKYYAALLLVAYSLLLLKERGKAYTIRFFLSSLIVPAVFILPFLFWDWKSYVFNMTFWSTWRGNTTFWLFVYRFLGLDWRTKEKLFINPALTMVHFGSIALTVVSFLMVLREIRSGTNPIDLSTASLLSVLVFNKLVHSNYLFWIFPFLIISLLSGSRVTPKVAYVLLSLVPFYDRLSFRVGGITGADIFRAVLVPSVLLLLYLSLLSSLKGNRD